MSMQLKGNSLVSSALLDFVGWCHFSEYCNMAREWAPIIAHVRRELGISLRRLVH